MRRNLLAATLICCSVISSGQNSCDSSNLYGNWFFVKSYFSWNVPEKDSLIYLIDNAKKSTNTLTFNSVATCFYKTGKDSTKRNYTINQQNCKIYMRRKQKSKRIFIKEIILLDAKHLILQRANPHPYTISLYKKS